MEVDRKLIVSHRYAGEVHDLREFVQPGAAMVASLAGQLARPTEQAFVMACLDWVNKNIQYPFGEECPDWHYYEAFWVSGPGKPEILIQRFSCDYWQFPAETLATGMGDCEDSAILLCSLLRTRVAPEDVAVTVGTFKGEGHAWVVYRGLVLEPTPVGGVYEEAYPYTPQMRFNDQTPG